MNHSVEQHLMVMMMVVMLMHEDSRTYSSGMYINPVQQLLLSKRCHEVSLEVRSHALHFNHACVYTSFLHWHVYGDVCIMVLFICPCFVPPLHVQLFVTHFTPAQDWQSSHSSEKAGWTGQGVHLLLFHKMCCCTTFAVTRFCCPYTKCVFTHVVTR